MTRVDFYVLSDNNPVDQFTCAVAEKVRRQGLNIHIHTESRQTAARLDELLWTHHDISFLPHCLVDTEDSDEAPITIGWTGSDVTTGEVLINLCTNVPNFAASFARIIEIVGGQDPHREQARGRYRQYRELGFDLHSHELESRHAYT
ncbi:MAG: DNA polymerase III subunit chi [Gammaproteobacteria bacterium]